MLTVRKKEIIGRSGSGPQLYFRLRPPPLKKTRENFYLHLYIFARICLFYNIYFFLFYSSCYCAHLFSPEQIAQHFDVSFIDCAGRYLKLFVNFGPFFSGWDWDTKKRFGFGARLIWFTTIELPINKVNGDLKYLEVTCSFFLLLFFSLNTFLRGAALCLTFALQKLVDLFWY